MSFIPAVDRAIQRLKVGDPVRVTLEFLRRRAVGRANAVPLPDIIAHLRTSGVSMSEKQFQQTVLQSSRRSDYFIGSGRHGYYLIESQADAEEMRDFYEARIRRESENLDNLKRQARSVGWVISGE